MEQEQIQQQQQQQVSGTINGDGTSEITGGVCGNLHNNDFLTIQFAASFLLSSDGKTGKVTSGSGIIKTTYSGVHPTLYSLEGTSAFQSSSSPSCNLPPVAKFSITKPDGTQLRCGNTDFITFNSVPLRGSVTGNVDCTATTLAPVVGTTLTPPQNHYIKTHTTPPENVKIISATDRQVRRILNGAVNVLSKSITFQLSKPTDNFGIASLQCIIDGSTTSCPSSSYSSVIGYNNLNPGAHTFTFTAKDSAGNVSSDRFTWTISANAKN
jgi:hypothetical protein